MSKTQFLTNHFNDIVKNDVLPISAFTEIMVALVRKPLRPFMAEAVEKIHKSIAMIVTKEADDSVPVESAPRFRWRKLFHGIKLVSY